MEENTYAVAKYTGCAGLKRKQPSSYVDEAVTKKITTDYRALPLLERRLYEYTRVRHYSLLTNRLLASRWRVHVERYHEKTRTPFHLPKVVDYHFYKYHTRYIPSQSICNVDHHRMRLGIAPSLDARSRLPTPNDMQLRKTTIKPKRRARRLLNV